MKETELTLGIEKMVAVKIEAVDRFIKEYIEPIADVGNPEKLIKKPYEEWTQQDLQMLGKIYGTEEPNPLSDLIFRKKYDEVRKLEEEE